MGTFLLALIQLAWAEPIQPKYSETCILETVADHMRVTLNPGVPAAEIVYASQTTLKEFQDDIESQWGYRPDVITNAYVTNRDRIYLIDDSKYYGKFGRTIDDSVAHELTHFIQVRYQKKDLGDNESTEREAVEIQHWFRDSYMKPGSPGLNCRD